MLCMVLCLWVLCAWYRFVHGVYMVGMVDAVCMVY